MECHEAARCFPCEAIKNECFNELQAENKQLRIDLDLLRANSKGLRQCVGRLETENEKSKRLLKQLAVKQKKVMEQYRAHIDKLRKIFEGDWYEK